MTGYTVHTGSTEKFAEGWDNIFRKSGGVKSAKKGAKTKSAKAARQKKKKA